MVLAASLSPLLPGQLLLLRGFLGPQQSVTEDASEASGAHDLITCTYGTHSYITIVVPLLKVRTQRT